MIDVVAGILENNKGEILIARKKKGKSLEGYWEFPGGKIEDGERPEETLTRELKEEMNIDVSVTEYVCESVYHYEKGTIRLIAYKGNITSGSIQLTDHDKYEWIDVHELKNYKLAPADIPIGEILINQEQAKQNR